MAGFDWARWWTLVLDAAAAPMRDPAAARIVVQGRLEALLQAAARAPYLASRVGARPAGGWRLGDLPTFTKTELMSHFDDCVTVPGLRLSELRAFTSDRRAIGQAFRDRYAAWVSSGSSGEPGLFVHDERALAVYDALESTRRACRRPLARLLDPLLAGERIAFVGALDGHFTGIASFERLRRLNLWLRPRLRALSLLQPLSDLDKALDDFDPTMLFTSPTTAVVLAEESRRGRLRGRPREIWTGGETLTPAMRRFVADTFGCPVANEYGASEFPPLATECRCGAMHVCADWAILESVDADGQAVAPGTWGERCLLTNLANHAQPLIRYELDDRVAISPSRCACGSAMPVVEVAGRRDDLLRLGAPGAAVVLLSPMALTTLLEDEAQLLDFQVVQHGPDRLELRCRDDGMQARRRLRRGREVLARHLRSQGAPSTEISLRPGTPPVSEASGKFKRVLAGADVDLAGRAARAIGS
ncbi:MAG: phenylacetate--CoA ligase family protein [Burkholderiaceae bacterium]